MCIGNKNRKEEAEKNGKPDIQQQQQLANTHTRHIVTFNAQSEPALMRHVACISYTNSTHIDKRACTFMLSRELASSLHLLLLLCSQLARSRVFSFAFLLLFRFSLCVVLCLLSCLHFPFYHEFVIKWLYSFKRLCLCSLLFSPLGSHTISCTLATYLRSFFNGHWSLRHFYGEKKFIEFKTNAFPSRSQFNMGKMLAQ